MACLLFAGRACVSASLPVRHRRRDRASADFADIDEIVREDPPSLGEQALGLLVGWCGWSQLEVRCDTAHGNGSTQEFANALLEGCPTALRDVPEESLTLREAQGDHVAVHGDGPADHDERLDGRHLA